MASSKERDPIFRGRAGGTLLHGHDSPVLRVRCRFAARAPVVSGYKWAGEISNVGEICVDRQRTVDPFAVHRKRESGSWRADFWIHVMPRGGAGIDRRH